MSTPYIPHAVRELLRPYREQIAAGELRLESGSHHVRLRNTKSNDWIPLPGTPGGTHRWITNLRAEINRLATTGRGHVTRTRRGADCLIAEPAAPAAPTHRERMRG